MKTMAAVQPWKGVRQLRRSMHMGRRSGAAEGLTMAPKKGA